MNCLNRKKSGMRKVLRIGGQERGLRVLYFWNMNGGETAAVQTCIARARGCPTSAPKFPTLSKRTAFVLVSCWSRQCRISGKQTDLSLRPRYAKMAATRASGRSTTMVRHSSRTRWSRRQILNASAIVFGPSQDISAFKKKHRISSPGERCRITSCGNVQILM